MDAGEIVMQTVCAADSGPSRENLRRRIFVQQCNSLLQVARWLDSVELPVTVTEVSRA